MAREKIKPQIYKLKDEKSPRDEYFQYTSELRQQRTPIVIDNGKMLFSFFPLIYPDP